MEGYGMLTSTVYCGSEMLWSCSVVILLGWAVGVSVVDMLVVDKGVGDGDGVGGERVLRFDLGDYGDGSGTTKEVRCEKGSLVTHI